MGSRGPKGTGDYSVSKWRTVWGDEILTSMFFASNFFICGIPDPYNVQEQLFNVMNERQAIPECPPASNSPL